MAKSINKVILIGNVGGDPETRTTASGSSVTKCTLATNRKYKDGSGNVVEDTQWHRLTFFGRLGEIVDQYVKKGEQLYVEGRVEYSKSEGDDGNTRYWTDIICFEMAMLGSSGPGPNYGNGDDEMPF